MNPRRILRSLVGIDSSPERTAAAFAVGVFIGFSPFLGFHTVLGLAIAFLFRFNRLAVLLGVYANTPWFMLPYYSLATWLGFRLFGKPEGMALPEFKTSGLLDVSFWWSLAREWRLLIPPTIAAMILCTLLALISYPVALALIRHFRAIHFRSIREARRRPKVAGRQSLPGTHLP